jgi:SAM-dependent methyltransferase
MVRVQLYRLSTALLGLVENLIALKRALHNGFWLGLLDNRHLHEVDRAHYSGAGGYLGDEHNLRGLREWEERAIADHMAGAHSFLVLAAGGGREVIALLDRGHEAEGWECNPDLVATGNRILAERGADVRLHVSERDRCPPVMGTYDAILVGWSAYTHIQGRARRVRLLEELRPHLAPDGKILVSFLFRRGPELRLRITARVASPLRRLRGAEAVELGDDLIPTFAHLFTEEEIRVELEQAGYDILSFRTAGYSHAVARPQRRRESTCP